MDQQAGGILGSRGPGETASELLGRQIDGRLAMLHKAFEHVVTNAETQRKQRSNCKRIALVGYTNAGKTTLMNGLTDTKLSAADRPFETLDTTSRNLTRHGGDVLLSDTVGFIRDLPERLYASFESTLAEITDASLLALVVDMSDREHEQHLVETERVLKRLGAERIPRFYVFTKVDQCNFYPTRWKQRMLSRGAPHMALQSQDSKALRELRASLLEEVRRDQPTQTFVIPYGAKEATSMVYAHCRILEVEPQEQGMRFRIQADSRWLKSIAAILGRPQ
jgi:GTP-binding protein HflX